MRNRVVGLMEGNPVNQFGGRAALVLAFLLGMATPSLSDERPIVEIRTYDVFVKDRPAGGYRVTYEPLDANTTKVSLKAQVSVSILLFSYKYSLDAIEIWRDGRLEAFEGHSNDNGTKAVVAATFAGHGAKVVVNGKERPLVDPCVWATTYSCLPKIANLTSVPLLDVDTGEARSGSLKWIEFKTLNVGGRSNRCDHFRATGVIPTEVWFDEQGRMVQQNFIDDGYPTEIRLKNVQRNDETPSTEIAAGKSKRR